ncbi:MAG: ATP-binding protein [Actinomycetia bacterium]|nr:ATP-binding protein [Actinomycetes bacterium]
MSPAPETSPPDPTLTTPGPASPASTAPVVQPGPGWPDRLRQALCPATPPALADYPRGVVGRLVAVLAAIAACQALAWPLAVWTTSWEGVASPRLAQVSYGIGLASTLAALGWGWWRRSFPVRLVQAGAAVAGLALVLGGAATAAGYATAYAHPSVPLAVWAGMLAAVCLPGRQTAVVLAGLALTYVAGAIATLVIGPVVLSGLATELVSLVGVPVLTRLVVPPWLAASATQARATAELELATQQVKAAEARELERAKQYRTLHDTVLSTLSALSRGSLDPQQHDIRRRIAADADYLRGLIATTDSAAGMYLVGEIARLTREQAPSGLRVHPHIADVPDVVPSEVVRAVSDSVREALNNVVKHSGTQECWVTVVGATPEHPVDVDGRTRLMVTVTDRGKGFDPSVPARGLGVKGSIVARMSEAGGVAEIDSEPGQGTTVELRWPR